MKPKRASEFVKTEPEIVPSDQHCAADQWFIVLNRQAPSGEIPANRSHPCISAGQRSRTWAADWGGGDDHCSRKTTAGVLTGSCQQVGTQNKLQILVLHFSWSVAFTIHTVVLLPSRLDSAENQVDDTIFILESYISSSMSSWESELFLMCECCWVWLFYSFYYWTVSAWSCLKSK